MDNKRFALLIDSDNISAEYIGLIINEMVEKHGLVTYKRIYGDWTSTQASKWKERLLEYSITPIQQFSNVYGKNATDSAMIIDAMDILHEERVDGFCLVSSDSDFTRLATRLRESGMIVVGMGEEKTPRSFRNACSIFTNLQVLSAGDKSSDMNSDNYIEGDDLSRENIIKEIEYIIIENKGDGGMTGLSEIGSRLVNKYPEFDVRNYGYSLLSKFIEDIPSFSLHRENNRVFVSMSNVEGYKDQVMKYIVSVVRSNNKPMELADLGQKIHDRFPEFDVKDFGYSKLSTMVKSIKGMKVEENKTCGINS